MYDRYKSRGCSRTYLYAVGTYKDGTREVVQLSNVGHQDLKLICARYDDCTIVESKAQATRIIEKLQGVKL